MTKIHFRPYNPNQTVLFPPRIDEDIAEHDPVRMVDALVESLNLESFRKLYKECGRSPYHPRMMLKVILYAYMNNIYSCRKIEKLLHRDIHYIWLAGYEKPDFITINRFRNRVKKEINEVFTQTVVLLSSKGFISLNVEYIDGTKIESKANKYTFVWRKTVERNRERLMKKIHVLLGQIDDVIAREKSSENNEEVGFTPAMLAEMAGELRHALEQVSEPSAKEEKTELKKKRKQLKELEEHRDKLQAAREEFLFQDGQGRYFYENEGGCHAQRTDEARLQPSNRHRKSVHHRFCTLPEPYGYTDPDSFPAIFFKQV